MEDLRSYGSVASPGFSSISANGPHPVGCRDGLGIIGPDAKSEQWKADGAEFGVRAFGGLAVTTFSGFVFRGAERPAVPARLRPIR